MDIERTKSDWVFYAVFCAVAVFAGLALGYFSVALWLPKSTAVKVLVETKRGETIKAVRLPSGTYAEVERESPNVAKPTEPLLDARFRYIRSNDGLWAVEVLQPNGTWTTGPSYNVWRTKKEVQFDINWWKDKWRTEEEQARRVWTNSN